MTANTVSPSPVVDGSVDALAARAERLALPAILLVAALNFFWQLGSSSYFIDEAYSVIHSLPSFHTMFHVIGHTETTPYTYFLFLHEWMAITGSQAEWVTRLPSAVAGVALVAAVYWMAGAWVPRRAALGAAALTAISPLIQSYAQETRVYVFLMLAVVLAAGATVRATQRPTHRARLLTAGALSAALAIWLHYTAISVVLPLLVWVATRSDLSRRARWAYVAACAAACGTVLPVLLEQYHYNPNGGAIAGAINWTNVVAVVGTPFGTRIGVPVNARTVTGALVMVAAVLVLLAPRGRQIRHRGLLGALAAIGVLGLLAVDLTGKHILITRYTVVAAPFMTTAVAAACWRLPRSVGPVLVTAAVVVSAIGLVDNHSPSGFYPPARQVVDYIAPREHRGDFMLTPGFPLTDAAIYYYDTRRMRPKLHLLGLNDRAQAHVFRTHRRVWLVSNPPVATDAAALASVQWLLRKYHFRAASVAAFRTSLALGVVLAERARR